MKKIRKGDVLAMFAGGGFSWGLYELTHNFWFSVIIGGLSGALVGIFVDG